METVENDPANYPPCLICSSPVIPSDIKVEPYLEDQDDNKSCINFLLSTILEIPQNSLTDLQEKLTNQTLINSYCEPCTKLIYSANQIYTQILELTRKFRKIQTQIVSLVHLGGTTLSTSNHDGLFHLCRNDLNKNDFNGFGYPFVVNETITPKSTECQQDHDPLNIKVKEEPTSENEYDDNKYSNELEEENDEDNPQKSCSSYTASQDSQSESNSDWSEPPPPPPAPKKAAKKAAKKPPPRRKKAQVKPKKETRKSRIAKALENPLAKNKLGFLKPLSKFEVLHPNYPKLLQNPTTKMFHCSEPSCSKNYNRKARLERHIIIEHLQDNFYKCEEPSCGKSYASVEIYQDHVSWHAGTPRWKCEEKVTTPSDGSDETVQCTEQFYSRKQLNRHVQQVHQVDNPFICELCGKRVSCQEYLSTHKSHYHNPNNPVEDYRPVDEGKRFRRKKEPIEICDYCGKSFKLKSYLDLHRSMIHEKSVGQFECQFCELKFSRKIWLKVHLWKKHEFSLEGYQLPPPLPPPKVVDKTEALRGKRDGGDKGSQKRKAYQCKVKGCKLGYRKEETLRKHMEKMHDGGKGDESSSSHFQFLCKYCGKGFHIKYKKDFHEEAHENKESKPFSCEICGKRFATLPYLKIHNRNIHRNKGEGAGAGVSKI